MALPYSRSRSSCLSTDSTASSLLDGSLSIRFALQTIYSSSAILSPYAILKLQSNAELVAKIKDISASIKELRQSLSEDLVQYVNVAGVNEIEDEEGMPREIIFSAKLKSKAFTRD